MNNKLFIYSSVFLGIVLSTTSIVKFQNTHKNQVDLTSSYAQELSATSTDDEQRTLSHKDTWVKEQAILALTKNAVKVAPAVASPAPKVVASRGSSVNATPASTTKKAVELLDWWKSARNVFSINSIAEVKDVYTGKTFRIKRTMGSNHADCEALTAKDAAIIKSIWGGFSWDVRPIIVSVGGRRLAASMSSLPHAGVDSAPAYQVVDNRSEGYGTGENLDVVKGNGMNGHFDVHFLNSTRHKDGQVDPRHQAAIKIAAKQ